MMKGAVVLVAVVVAACGAADGQPAAISASTVVETTDTDSSAGPAAFEPSPGTRQADTAPPVQATTVAPNGSDEDGENGRSDGEAQQSGAVPAPPWLGTRTLPTLAGGAVVTPQTTPPELRDRRLVTVDRLPPPTGTVFEHTLGPVPAEVLARSTWNEDCPVTVDELSYLTMSFWGFDDRAHTGEMIVNASVAADIVTVFATLFEARFPIEEMTVVDLAALGADPTGDGNNTTAFVCRAVTGGSRFSEHAYGLAIDINPFHNPYLRGEVVLPELAVDYLDRGSVRSGMVATGGPAVAAFAAIGWSWGGDWRSLKDYQHFTLNNR